MTGRTIIEIDTPENITLGDALQQIAQEVDEGNEDGHLRDDDRRLSWEIVDASDGVEIDRRQRLAAAALMMGFDLPQEAMAASRSMLAAARLCPGMTTGDMVPMGSQTRRHALQMAKGLIEEMQAEIDGAPAPEEGVQVLRLFRLPVELDDALRRMARRDDTSFEKLVVRALTDLIAREGGE